MPRFDTRYQAFRREQLHKYSNMDPDCLVSELQVDTNYLIDVLWEIIETTIEENYDDNHENEDDQDA